MAHIIIIIPLLENLDPFLDNGVAKVTEYADLETVLLLVVGGLHQYGPKLTAV